MSTNTDSRYLEMLLIIYQTFKLVFLLYYSLRDCKITDEGFEALASTHLTHLKELDLSHNKLRNPGIKLISTALENPNCKLEILQ